ncbi:MAG: sugar ABC transporter permease [Clostridia bacterium]|nr:sugar ABC transporter permease [Clostridia bacterium]MBR0026916.1 sugar ABC transporter permease [Clostridia bacterium]
MESKAVSQSVPKADYKSVKPMAPLQSTKARKRLKVVLFLAPMVIFALLFVYYPFVKTIVNSFSTVNEKGQITGFAGFENYEYVFGRSDFKKAIGNTLLLTVINVPLTLLITISLALLANKRRRFSSIYETLFTLPMAISMSAACMIFKAMFSPTLGIINHIFNSSLGWFESRDTALYTCIIITIWMGIGFDFLLFQSALRGIPAHIMEAAKLDGAGFFTRVFKIQLPMISPTIFYVLCTNTVRAMMTSGPMIIITQGGPARSTTTLMYMMFASGYGSSNYSLAAVVSLVAFVLTLGFTLLSFVYERKKVHYQ